MCLCIYKLFEHLRNQELIISMGTKFQCKFEETTSVSVSKTEKSAHILTSFFFVVHFNIEADVT